VLTLLGAKSDGDGKLLSHQDGTAFEPVIAEPGRARHVIGFLFDGANPNVLHDLAMRGAAPNVARLMSEGTACRYGVLARSRR